MNAAGQVGFIGTLVGGDTFLFIEDEVVWLASDEVPPLTSIQPHVVTFDGAAFVLSASGTDVLWTNSGALVMDGDPAPGFSPSPTAAVTNLQRLPN